MAAVSASHPSRIHSPEIIDVDALEDEPVVFTGFHGRPRQPPQARSSAGPSVIAHDEDITYTGFRRRSSRRALYPSSGAQAGPSAGPARDDVIVLDSDEDMPSSSSGRRSSRLVNRSRLISPPPPPAQRGHTPGVPPLPSHLSSQASLPRLRRHRAIEAVPPPIRPLAQPLPFEDRMPSLPRLPPRNAAAPPVPAPRSHHHPSMGLGGALIALDRQNAIQEAANRATENRARGLNLPSFTDIFRRISGVGGGGSSSGSNNGGGDGHEGSTNRTWGRRMWQWAWNAPELDADHIVLSPFAQNDAWFGPPDIPFHHRGRFDPPAEKIALWKPEYTHPDKTAPGFTHDFAPPDDVSSASSPPTTIVLDEAEAGPSSSASASSSATAVETTLVCAHCLDPLVLASADGTTEVDAKKRRVWALRCGHMLDGKCITELMFPSETPASREAVEPHAPVQDVKGKSKGKARAEPEAGSSTDETSTAAAMPDAAPDRKGKRKAVEPLEPESPKRQAHASPTSSPSSSPPASPPEDNSIRSRLRPRARGSADASSTATPPAGAAPAPHPEAGPSISIATSPHRSRRQHEGAVSLAQTRAKGKGKGRARVARKPAVEAEHEWRCPVGGCGCVHYSVRVEGVWKNDEGRGPIALFV